MSEYDHGPTFPIGGLGDGSIVFIDLESGRVRGYNRDSVSYTHLDVYKRQAMFSASRMSQAMKST